MLCIVTTMSSFFWLPFRWHFYLPAFHPLLYGNKYIAGLSMMRPYCLDTRPCTHVYIRASMQSTFSGAANMHVWSNQTRTKQPSVVAFVHASNSLFASVYVNHNQTFQVF